VPYFKWQGVDLRGCMRRGTLFARSQDHLDGILLKRDIALINARQAKPLISLPVTLSLKIHFFRRLAALLRAGVLLPQALSVLAESMEHVQFQEIINDMEKKIKGGFQLHNALESYPSLFAPVMIHMISVGQEAGALALSLQILSDHLEAQQHFYKKIRSVTMLPAVSFLFFIGIALIIFIGIMPLFLPLFETMQQEMPTATRWLMNISMFLGSWKAIFYGTGLGFLFWLCYRIMGKMRRKKMIDRLVVTIPGIRHIVMLSGAFSFFNSVAMLLKGGMQLVPALRISKKAVSNHILQKQLEEIERAAASGTSLSQALSQNAGLFSRPDIEAMIAVGQESGTLAGMLSTIAHDYQERLERLLNIYSTLLQPVLMIVLGLLIALLIIAVYMPILSLSYAVA